MIFDLGTVMLFSTVAVGVLGFKFYRRFNDGMYTTAIWTMMTIVLMIGLLLIAIMLINQRRFPSHVDTSPLAQLTAEQVARIEDVWIQFEAHESVLHFRAESLSNNRELDRRYSIVWQDEDFISMRISVSVFHDEKTPINSMQNIMSLMDNNSRREYTYVAYDNNTEAVLEHIFTDTSYISSSRRAIWTDIRIGNVRIQLRERRHANNLENDFSSQFIALLVEMLQEE